jgi:acyl-CoA thioester hydrolase
MQRVKIDLPGNFSFSIRIPVRITDINYGNHLGNQVMLSIAHEARVQYLQQYGYTELNVEGVSLIMADAGIEFKAEVLYGDELEVEVATGATSRVGFDLLYRTSIWRNGEKILAAKIKTGLVCFDYNTKKTVELPLKAKQHLTGTIPT